MVLLAKKVYHVSNTWEKYRLDGYIMDGAVHWVWNQNGKTGDIYRGKHGTIEVDDKNWYREINLVILHENGGTSNQAENEYKVTLQTLIQATSKICTRSELDLKLLHPHPRKSYQSKLISIVK